MNLNFTQDIGESRTILMFSGGRDSTLAALRLDKIGAPMTFVTITSKHLEGIRHVQMRLRELATFLPERTPWLHIEQPIELRTNTSFYDQTCLPCHHAYVVVAIAIAKAMNASKIAFGYTKYQNDWPEQTPLAVLRLTNIMSRQRIDLVLPVSDIISREQAILELNSNNISSMSLEQKCFRQVTNVTLSATRLIQQIDLWEDAIERSIAALPDIPITVISNKFIGDFSK